MHSTGAERAAIGFDTPGTRAGSLPRDDVDDTAYGLGAVERALRTSHDLDPVDLVRGDLDAGHVVRTCRRGVHLDPVDEKQRVTGVGAAEKKLRDRPGRPAAHDVDSGGELQHIDEPASTTGGDLVAPDYRNAAADATDVLRLALGGDNDLFVVPRLILLRRPGSLRWGRGSRQRGHGGRQRNQSDGGEKDDLVEIAGLHGILLRCPVRSPARGCRSTKKPSRKYGPGHAPTVSDRHLSPPARANPFGLVTVSWLTDQPTHRAFPEFPPVAVRALTAAPSGVRAPSDAAFVPDHSCGAAWDSHPLPDVYVQ